jgi:hypothetical protein
MGGRWKTPTTLGFKDLHDLPMWRPIAYAPAAGGAGTSLAWDQRNTEDRHPEIFFLQGTAAFYKYNYKNDEWWTLPSPALSPSVGAGSDSVFVPEAGPSGTIASGATTTKVTLSTALPAAVALNGLANRGDGRGFKLRIIDNVSGGSGKTDEQVIIANSAGTTPDIYLGSALAFTPASGAAYQFLSGKVYLLANGAIASGTFKSYDVATQALTTLSQTNLPSTIGTDSFLLSLSELYVPYNTTPNQGFFGNLTATGSSSTTITGQASGGDAAVLANEYRNFQIRIVQDTTTPTSVGQRRRIVSHTAGPSAVYTVSAWTVTPSSSAVFVIEGWGDCILLWSTASTTTYNYSISGNAWDAGTTWAARANADGAGVEAYWCSGLVETADKQRRNSHILSLRGAGTSDIDLFDIAGAATGSWTAQLNYPNKSGTTFTTGMSGAYDPVSNLGRYAYININGTQRFMRLDLLTSMVEPWCWFPYSQGSVVVGGRVALATAIDGTTKTSYLIHQRCSDQLMFSCLAQRGAQS